MEVDNGAFSLANTNPVAISGKVVTLMLASAVTHGQTVTVSYVVPSSNPIQDGSGNDATALNDRAVTNNTRDTTAPVLDTATVDGVTLKLTYDEGLDMNSTPAATDFTVKAGGSSVSLANTNPVAISGKVVTLMLASAVTHGQTVTVSYVVPSSNPIQDGSGNDAAALSNEAVTNNTSLAVKLLTAAVNGEGLFLRYNKELDTDSVPAAGAFSVKVDGGTGISPSSVSTIGRQVVRLVLRRAVTSGQTVTVSYTAPASNPIQDTAGNKADNLIDQAVTNRTGPKLTVAAVDGTALTLTYDVNLDEDSVPAASALTVTVAGTGANPSTVAISGKVVTLTLASAVTHGQTVTVPYAVPDTNPIQDTSGNDATALTDQAVTNNTGVANRPPIMANPIPDQSVTEGTAYSYTFAVNTFNDADGDVLTYTAEEDDGTVLPSWLNFAADDRTFSGTAVAEDVGTVSVTVTASDGRGGSARDTFNITVSPEETSVSPTEPPAVPDENKVPTVANEIPDQETTEGLEFVYTFPDSTFSDADEDTLSYTAVRGDDGSLPSWLGFDNTSRTFSGTPGSEDVGTLEVKVTADDGRGGTVSDTFNITVAAANKAPTVANEIPDQKATEGSEFRYRFKRTPSATRTATPLHT